MVAEHRGQHTYPTGNSCPNPIIVHAHERTFYGHWKDVLGEYCMPWKNNQSKCQAKSSTSPNSVWRKPYVCVRTQGMVESSTPPKSGGSCSGWCGYEGFFFCSSSSPLSLLLRSFTFFFFFAYIFYNKYLRKEKSFKRTIIKNGSQAEDEEGEENQHVTAGA